MASIIKEITGKATPTKGLWLGYRRHHPFKFTRRSRISHCMCGRATGDEDVTFKLLHEIVGIVTEVGSKVQKFKVGDRIGVGCLVGACHSCGSCSQYLENYCPVMVLTYNPIDYDRNFTCGGYSDIMVVNKHYAILFPENLPLDAGAPLLCAAITVYSPLKYYGLDKPSLHIGMTEAIQHLGAEAFLVSCDPEQMQGAMGTIDGIIDMVSAFHPLMPLIGLLKTDRKLVMVGAPEMPL
ncbi:Alcohol dehydrogenase, N-terminal [Dillenia turbinata]|uniref:Alcohol dehydrogenase, N-terminal n=1 Tax=Dillenia turbinata TaxID=194707 RepID=A0AAN8UU75_9MAGN